MSVRDKSYEQPQQAVNHRASAIMDVIGSLRVIQTKQKAEDAAQIMRAIEEIQTLIPVPSIALLEVLVWFHQYSQKIDAAFMEKDGGAK